MDALFARASFHKANSTLSLIKYFHSEWNVKLEFVYVISFFEGFYSVNHMCDHFASFLDSPILSLSSQFFVTV